jgi:predicted MFS family arabinose efflux permease
VTLILAVVPAILALSWAGSEYPWVSIPIVAMLALSAVMGILFAIIESRSKEPIIPLSLFRNRIVAISEVVIFFSGFAMFGGIIFIPLFFQGVLGSSATTSGTFLTPMMLGLVMGGFISGQLLSRAGGHYRVQGAVGIAIMALGMALLSRMTVDTSYRTAVVNIVVMGFGLGIILPLYTIAVQNAVPYSVLGVATSSTAFFRSIGASVGLAIFGSVMTNRFASEFANNIPPTIKAIIPPELLASLAHNPQALVSAEAQDQLRSILEQTGPQGSALFEQLLQVLRQALDSALSEVFLIGLFVVALAFVIHLFIREIPLRKQHMPEM